MFYLLHFWCSTLHLMKSAQHCLYNSGIKVDILDTCGAMICSYFGIAFLLFFIKIENAVYTSCQNSTLLFINGLIFDIMNTQTSLLNLNENQCYHHLDLSMIKGFHLSVMFSLSSSKIGWILFRNAKATLKEMLARKCSYHGAANIWRIEKMLIHWSYPIFSLTSG